MIKRSAEDRGGQQSERNGALLSKQCSDGSKMVQVDKQARPCGWVGSRGGRKQGSRNAGKLLSGGSRRQTTKWPSAFASMLGEEGRFWTGAEG